MPNKTKKVKIEEKLKGFSGSLKFTFRDVKTGKIKRTSEYKNVFVTVAKNMIAQRLAGSGNDCNITYGAVGTNVAAPIAGSTTLGTELDRDVLAGSSSSGNVVSVTVFFGASAANGTLTEFGLFGEAASAAADSGTMINHAVITETKTSAETMAIEIAIIVG